MFFLCDILYSRETVDIHCIAKTGSKFDVLLTRAQGKRIQSLDVTYVPPKNAGNNLPRTANGGYIDKFNNVWQKGPSRTIGEAFEWDVQLSKQGKNMLGWLSRDGAHLNVSLRGIITH